MLCCRALAAGILDLAYAYFGVVWLLVGVNMLVVIVVAMLPSLGSGFTRLGSCNYFCLVGIHIIHTLFRL